jgi:3'-phosphoadenosine 5'-phosphosulfate (PAPS) 3'-phosphatase
MEKELETAISLAREAGRILLEYYQNGAQVHWKGHNDPVTAADHAANEMLVRELHRRFPHDAILSEEIPDDLARLNHDRVWMIDPMDGTKQFIERIDEFAVMIGLAIEGEAKLGCSMLLPEPALSSRRSGRPNGCGSRNSMIRRR